MIGADEHSLRKLDAMPCKNWEVPAAHHNPSIEANRVLKIKTFPSVCRKVVMLDDSLGTRQFPVTSRNVENLHEFLHVDDSARQQEWTRPFQRVLLENGCLHRSRKISPRCRIRSEVLQVKELGGLTEQSDWTDSPLDIVFLT